MEKYTFIKLTIGVILTIGLYTILFRENKFYRLVEHIFLGLAAGWGATALWTETLYENWWLKTVGNSDADTLANGNWAYALLLPLGIMAYFVVSKKHNWIARIPVAVIVGLWSGQQIQVWWNRFGPQIRDSIKPVIPTTLDRFTVPQVEKDMSDFEISTINNLVSQNTYASVAISNLIFIITLLSVLSYFLFSVDFKNKLLRGTTTMGRWLLMVGFGAIFGSTVMTRFTFLIDRMSFIWIEWFKDSFLKLFSGG